MPNKVYVITGSTSGIGRALTEKLAQDNIVFAGYRNDSQIELIQSISKNVYPFFIDYTKPESIRSASIYIKEHCTKIDTIVNVAGCVAAGPIEKIDINALKNQFDVNVFGHIELTQNLINLLENGKIINISSMASYGFFPFISPYCASKKALDILFNALHIENKKNIKVVSIKPGVISTPLWNKSIKENSKFFEQFKEYSDEMNYVIKNAENNAKNGLSVEQVVKVILKADKAKKPKLTYTVGKDAFCARLISKLPQSLINTFVKKGIKIKCSKKK